MVNPAPSLNVVHRLLDTHLENGRGSTACVRSDRATLTYEEIYLQACRVANALAAAGVEYENRVMLVMPDSPEYVACVLGALRIGAVPVPVGTRLSPDDYAIIAADCRPKIAVIGSEQAGIFDRVRERTSFPRSVWVAGDPSGAPGCYAAMVAEASDDCPIHPVRLDDMAVIQYTSGTTGSPKGVVHLHRGLLGVLDGMIERLGLTAADVCFSGAKLSFGYGFGNSLLFPLASGASSALLGPLADAVRTLDFIQRHRPTVLFAVPALYSSMLAVSAEQGDIDLSSLRLCVSAGEQLPPSLGRRWRERFGLDLLNGLGSTECLHIFIASEPGVTPPGSVGTLVPGYQAEIRDDEGRVLGPGQTGHLWIKGAANGARYWNKHPETTATMVGGWNRTGDQLYRDDAGVYYFVARSDDVLKIGGLKVAPVEIEECLRQHEFVRECVVVGVPGRDSITVLTAYVLLRDNVSADENAIRRQLRAHARSVLAQHKCPRTFHFVTELPTTPTGKIARHLLRADARTALTGS